MKQKRYWVWLPLLLMWLVACGSQTETEPVVSESADGDGGQTAVQNEADVSDNQQAATMADFSPATSILEASIERERDYAKGGDDPLLTVIEYGDFQ